MKILMVAEGIERAGGAEEYLIEISRGLRDLGNGVSAIYGREISSSDLSDEALSKGSHFIKGLPIPEVLEKIRQINPDVVNFQNVIDSSLLTAVSLEKPTVVFIHNHESYCPGNSKYWFNSGRICPIVYSSKCSFYAYLEKCMTRNPSKLVRRLSGCSRDIEALSNVNKVICNSEYVAQNLIKSGVKSPIVNHLFSKFGAAASSLSKAHRNQVLFVGRLFKEKGVDHLLKALSLIKTEYEAVIAGDGWERSNLEKLSSDLRLSEKVKFTGFYSEDRLAELYSQSSLVAVPALWPEPFGLTGLEAFSFKKPVVGYDSGGIGEWLKNGENGFLVTWGDIEGLSKAIENLLTDKDLAEKLGETGLKNLETNFSLRSHLDKLIDVYRNI